MAHARTLPAPAAMAWTTFKQRRQWIDAVLERIGAEWRRFQAWRDRRATQSLLLSLDDAVLKDIGVERSEIGSLMLDSYDRRRRIKAARSFARSY